MTLLAADSPLRRALSYRKFCRAQKTILLLDSNYHLHSECRVALERRGHKVITLLIGGEHGAHDAAAAMRQLLEAMMRHKPDMVLTINHIGFDAHNSMGQLLDEIDMPVAVWYVDSPFLLFDGFFLPAAQVTTVFVWDRSYVPLLLACGAQDVAYLPLACDVQKFCPTAGTTVDVPVGFVGNSMHYAETKWRKMLKKDEQRHGKEMAQGLVDDRQNFLTYLGKPQAPQDRQVTALAYATWMATGWYRKRYLQALAAQHLHVFGDEEWKQVLPAAKRHPYVWYGTPLAQVYGRCACSFNATSLQMPSAVNQRVFDVPAAGGLVLTDAQQDVFELFEPDEITVYRSPEELASLSRYYVTHPTERAQRISRGYKRVHSSHTYEHRVDTLMARMQKRWAAQVASVHGGRRCIRTP